MSAAADPVAEAERIVAAAGADAVCVRACGGVGVALWCPSAAHPPLRRTYADIDLVGLAAGRDALIEVMAGLGYEADEMFNTLQGVRRLLFWDGANGRQVDVFLDRFEMCHALDLRDRLDGPSPALPLADLLLMKLQVVETNPKDLIDIIAILTDHDFTDDDAGINLPYLVALTSADWGLWRTSTMVADRAARFAATLDGLDGGAAVAAKVERMLDTVDAAPKSRQWRMRARLGDRKRWYELPEEVA